MAAFTVHFLLVLHFFIFPVFRWTVLAERACNNSPRLCGTPYDSVTYLGTHDSPFLRDPSTSFSTFGNQFFSTASQLDSGVRLLSGQVHVGSNAATGKRELHLCHTSCGLFDAGPLRVWLVEIRTWLDANPNDVVTILLVNGDVIDARELEGVYSEADLAHYSYIPPRLDQAPPLSNETHATWPTLGEMIDRNNRLVSFVAYLKPDKENAPYLLDELTFVWENYYAVTDPTNFTCTPDRPKDQTIYGMRESGRLFLMNHFLYWQQAFGIQVPDTRTINVTNAWNGSGALGEHLVNCSEQVGRQPTFVLVDFFNVGPAIESIDIFNKVDKPVGRLNVTKDVIDGKAGLNRVNRAGSSKGILSSTSTLMVAAAAATIHILVW